MNMKKRAYGQEELMTEFFGFLPKRFVDDLYDSMNSYFYEVIEGLNDRLSSLYPGEEQKIAESLKEYEKDTERRLDKYFNTFQEYINIQIWQTPDDLDIQLNHYKDIDMNITEEHEASTVTQLDKLRKDIINQKKLQKFLEMNFESVENELNTLDEYSQLLSFLSTEPEQHKVDDIEVAMKLVKKNLDGIRDNIVMAIRNLTRDLKTLDQNDTNERAKYLRSSIEHQLNLFRKSLLTQQPQQEN